MTYPLSDTEFRQIYAKVPRLCVDIVVRKDNRILLSKRTIDPYLGLWHIPGGTVYFGETLEQAVKRVAQDELGLTVIIKSLLAYLDYPDERKGDWHGWPIALEFDVEVISGRIHGSNQAEDIQYFDRIPDNTVETQKNFLIQKLGFQQEIVEK